ncbi:hypothetical protein EMCRGX_G033395 [Ephydatia muelleri]
MDQSGSENQSHGNFLTLLQFRAQAGDTILADPLATAARNATYTSSGIQNEIISILADQIRHQIITKVKVARWFTDEVTDAANKEQLSLVLRYVHPDNVLLTKSCTSSFCAYGLDVTYGLDLTYIRGQAYDGAGWQAQSEVQQL